MTKIINLFGGPGSGKSTTAAGLFFLMKHEGYKVELVTEYAKELVYEGLITHTSAKDILFGQWKRQAILMDKVDYIITDSPLLLGAVYAKHSEDRLDAKQWFNSGFDNINFFILRTKPYAVYGRTQTEEEAKQKCVEIKNLLLELDIEHRDVLYGLQAPTYILSNIEGTYG